MAAPTMDRLTETDNQNCDLFISLSSMSRTPHASRHQHDCLHMPWDNSVNKTAHIYAVVTPLGVRNMPLTGYARVFESVLWP